jgi:hypothetical protein
MEVPFTKTFTPANGPLRSVTVPEIKPSAACAPSPNAAGQQNKTRIKTGTFVPFKNFITVCIVLKMLINAQSYGRHFKPALSRRQIFVKAARGPAYGRRSAGGRHGQKGPGGQKCIKAGRVQYNYVLSLPEIK